MDSRETIDLVGKIYTPDFISNVCNKLGIGSPEEMEGYAKRIKHIAARYLFLKNANPKRLTPGKQNELLDQYSAGVKKLKKLYGDVHKDSTILFTGFIKTMQLSIDYFELIRNPYKSPEKKAHPDYLIYVRNHEGEKVTAGAAWYKEFMKNGMKGEVICIRMRCVIITIRKYHSILVKFLLTYSAQDFWAGVRPAMEGQFKGTILPLEQLQESQVVKAFDHAGIDAFYLDRQGNLKGLASRVNYTRFERDPAFTFR